MSMGDSAPTPPAPMDPNAVASTQQQYNVNAATDQQAMNAINQDTPFGSLTYSQTGTGPNGVPIYSASQKLSPEMQSIVNTLQGQSTNLLTGAGYGNGPAPGKIIGDATSGLTADLLSKNVQQIAPYMKMAHDQLDTQLRNQGFAPGQPGYDNAMRGLLDSQNRTIQGFEATIEPQAYSQATSNYLMPLQMSGAEMGMLNPIPGYLGTSLTKTPTVSMQPANYMGAVAQQQQMAEQQYQQQMQNYQSTMGGLFGIPTAILGGMAQAGAFGGAGAAGAGGIAGAMAPAIAFM